MALHYLTLLNFLCGCKPRLQEEILSMACVGTLGGPITGEIRLVVVNRLYRSPKKSAMSTLTTSRTARSYSVLGSGAEENQLPPGLT